MCPTVRSTVEGCVPYCRRTGVAPLCWSKKPGLFFRSKTRPKPDFEGGSENQSPEDFSGLPRRGDTKNPSAASWRQLGYHAER